MYRFMEFSVILLDLKELVIIKRWTLPILFDKVDDICDINAENGSAVMPRSDPRSGGLGFPVINYFWLGLIVIAVFFAVYMDLAGQPPYEQPLPVLLSDFSTDPGWQASGLGRFSVEDKKGDGPGRQGLLHYRFDPAEDKVELLAGLRIDAATESPEALAVRFLPDGSGHQLAFEFSDADGERFAGAEEYRLTGSPSEKSIRIALSGLKPLAENPSAVADYPLTLERILMRRSAASSMEEGEIRFESLALVYPPVFRVKEELQSETWMGVVTKSSARWAGTAITLAIELIGIMMLWLGLMRIAEQAGLVQMVARAVKPVLRRLFPDIPPDGEAMGAIVMNIAANMLGLGNAATPIGLKAMEELQKLNRNKEYASNAMCMLLAINTSSVELIPATVIGYRVAAGSGNIMEFWPLMVATTVISTTVAVLACKICEGLPWFRIPEPPVVDTLATGEGGE